MRLHSIFLGVVAPSLIAAKPVAKRQTGSVTDADILNYALTLEHLEDTFYRQGLSNFTQAMFASAGFNSTFYNNLRTISGDESTHVSFLTAGLTAAGATPVQACTYNFPYTDVRSFLTLASVLEGVGVSAYLGAAQDIMSKMYLTDAASILTVESRHSAYLRSSLGQAPVAQPFDTPLTLNEVYSLASQYIVACPSSNPPLPVRAFPPLALSNNQTSVAANSTITLVPGNNTMASGQAYAAFIAVTGPTIVPATRANGGYSVMVPPGFAGETYVILTSDRNNVTDDSVIAGPAILEIPGTALPVSASNSTSGSNATMTM